MNKDKLDLKLRGLRRTLLADGSGTVTFWMRLLSIFTLSSCRFWMRDEDSLGDVGNSHLLMVTGCWLLAYH